MAVAATFAVASAMAVFVPMPFTMATMLAVSMMVMPLAALLAMVSFAVAAMAAMPAMTTAAFFRITQFGFRSAGQFAQQL